MTEAAIRHPASLMIWLPWLVGLQSIPGTGALRTLFLLLGMIHLAWLWRRAPEPLPRLRGTGEQVIFWLLTGWLVVQSSLIAPLPALSLHELAGNWGKLILMAGLGIGAARLVPDRRWLCAALFAGAFLHVVSTLGLQVVSVAKGGGLIFGDSLLGNYGYVSPFTTAAFAWLLADGMARIWHGRSLFPWPATVSAILMMATLAAEVLLRAKAGQLMVGVLVLVATVAFLLRPGPHRRWAVGLALAGIVALGGSILAGGNRWQGAVDDFQVAWQEPSDPRTLTGTSDPAATINRIDHDVSIYLRTAWAKMGLEGIARHPWGLGYGADAFGRYVEARYGIKGAVSSHSGWIDFALANGVPGLCLLLALALALMRRGWLAFVSNRPEGTALALLVLHYIARSSFDGSLAGSRLTGFAFVAGALWALSAVPARKTDAGRPG